MMRGEKIRVLVADDSAFMRKVLFGILDSDGGFEIVGEACDGREAVEKNAKLKPQVITMDINMPHMDGLQATEVIMSTEPRPIPWPVAAVHGVRLPVAVLAASTGGPATLMKLLPQFRAGFPAALLVVQHMPGSFTPQFAEQLASVSHIPVKQAENG